ncbi:uncharacterized protein LOC112656094 isoform X4 [Canis lupus dingo]|uniref:uncharacterized protein LOC112656094 isoform X4 n=1 Tax=Canis lupus dingo TaxID=286419 RepID=UPI0020C3097E|nr:uncharacterized protein LOC112656094 isoform X4 [Canis lupus dingo]
MTWTLVTFIWEKAVLPPRAVQGRMKQKHIHSQSFNSASSYVLAVPVNCGGHLNILHGPHENAFGFAKMTSSTWSIVIIHTISSILKIYFRDRERESEHIRASKEEGQRERQANSELSLEPMWDSFSRS